jgi:hypothetical protein
MAKKPVTARRGRTWVALALAAFVIVAAGVIQRRVLGIRQGQQIRTLEDQLQAAEARRVKLASDVDDARSLGHLRPILVNKLGMRSPEETPTVLLRREPR